MSTFGFSRHGLPLLALGLYHAPTSFRHADVRDRRLQRILVVESTSVLSPESVVHSTDLQTRPRKELTFEGPYSRVGTDHVASARDFLCANVPTIVLQPTVNLRQGAGSVRPNHLDKVKDAINGRWISQSRESGWSIHYEFSR